VLHRRFLAADHQAVAALEAEDAAARADVDVVDPLRRELLGAAEVVDVVRVPAVNEDVAALEVGHEVCDGPVDHRRGDHHPDGARLPQPAGQLLQRGHADRLLARELRDGVGGRVEHHALVPRPDEPAHHVGAHPAETDHCQLHALLLVANRVTTRAVRRSMR
jgi:hypothetical protein